MSNIMMVLQVVVPLAASGIALAVITILVKRFGAMRSDTWRALVVTTFVMVAGGVAYFAMQAIETKISENEEAYKKSWIELLESGDDVRAERKLQRRIADLRKSYGGEHPDHSPMLYNLAYVYQEQGKIAKAERLYLDTLELDRSARDENFDRYCLGLLRLAGFYRGLGDFERAEPLYLEAFEVTAEAVGIEHPSYSPRLLDLARFYDSQQDPERAERYYLEALDAAEAAVGVEDSLYAMYLHYLAWFYQKQGDFERAETRYKQAMAIHEMASFPGSSEAESIASDYTRMLREMGRDHEADAVSQRVNSIVSEEEF